MKLTGPGDFPNYNPNCGRGRKLRRSFERMHAAKRTRRTALRASKCEHGWRGTVPENGKRIVDKCPSCGQAALFIGTGGYLTCGNLGPDCQRPDTGKFIQELAAERAKVEELTEKYKLAMDTIKFKDEQLVAAAALREESK